jgi:hypothetical protein
MYVVMVPPGFGGVVVVLAAGADDVVVDAAVVGVVAAAVLGPLAEIGLTSCTLCAGSRGLEPPGANTTSTTSRAPTTPRPANMPVRWDRDFDARFGWANSSWMTGAANTIVSSAGGGPTSTTGTFAVSSEKAPDVVPASAACFA